MWIHVLGAVWGLLLGSFSVAAIMRIRAGISPNEGRSQCGSCDRELTAIDLVPVVSWLALRGRCRTCGSSLSWRYPAGEALFGLAGALLATWPLVLAAVSAIWLLGLVIVGEVRARRGFRRL